MQLHDIKPEHPLKKKYRKGRGKRRGMYSGRGIKGQKARAGHKLQPIIRRILKKYHKKPGYRFKPLSDKPEVVNLERINKVFKEGETVSPETLVEKGVLRRKEKRLPKVKILGKGQIEQKLEFEDVDFSESALEKIKNV